MSIYNDQFNIGNSYLRKLDNSIYTLAESLSAVIEKYKAINEAFYNELILNRIVNFDVFYDCIFIETSTGYIIEKIYIEDDVIYPYYNNNFLTENKNTNTRYWFDEKNLKIYFFDVLFDAQATNYMEFLFFIKEFDCKSGLLFLNVKEKFYLELQDARDWGKKVPTIEPPVVSYNQKTKNYNVSFVFRNNTFEMGIISIMVDAKNELTVSKFDIYMPFTRGFGEFIQITL